MVELAKALSEIGVSLSINLVEESSKESLAQQDELIGKGNLAGALSIAEAWCAGCERTSDSAKRAVWQRMADLSGDWLTDAYYKLFHGGVRPPDAILPSQLALMKLLDGEARAARERVGELKYRLRIESTLTDTAP